MFLGRRFNLTLYDFGTWLTSQDLEANQAQQCINSVRIYEIATGETTTLCGDNYGGPYLSKTNIVDISFLVESDVDTRTELLLHYEGKLT